MPLRWRVTPLLLTSLSLGAGLGACDHAEPPESGVTSVDTIPIVGPPERLTLSQGKDAYPVFTPDGRGIWYGWERLDRPDHDLCLGLLPVGGGTRTHEVCSANAAATPDSVNWNTYPAPHPDGRRIAWQELSSDPDVRPDGSGGIILSSIAALGDPSRHRRLVPLPHQFAGDQPVQYFAQLMSLRWVNDSTLIGIGTLLDEFTPAFSQPDTFYTGLGIATITITGDTTLTGIIPGTDSASGLTLGPGGAIYFTKDGDQRVYRTTLAGGIVDTVFDFGPAGIARDPVYVDGAIYAVVGGDVSFTAYVNIGWIQHDGGGELWRTDTLGPVLIDNVYRWRRPALSPDGHTLVIEGRDPVSGVTDLYLLRIN